MHVIYYPPQKKKKEKIGGKKCLYLIFHLAWNNDTDWTMQLNYLLRPNISCTIFQEMTCLSPSSLPLSAVLFPISSHWHSRVYIYEVTMHTVIWAVTTMSIPINREKPEVSSTSCMYLLVVCANTCMCIFLNVAFPAL